MKRHIKLVCACVCVCMCALRVIVPANKKILNYIKELRMQNVWGEHIPMRCYILYMHAHVCQNTIIKHNLGRH